jgi:HSP20 family molecular chaperone IbpA
MSEGKDLKVREKQEAAAQPEQTHAGPVFTPAVDIFENDREITLLADMPGASVETIAIDLHKGVLTISGDVKPWESKGETDILIEFEIGKYYRQFTLTEVVDQDKIAARLEDGVLRVTLPKVAKVLPRKIAVTAP